MSISKNFFLDNEDLKFQFDQIDFESFYEIFKENEEDEPKTAKELKDQCYDLNVALGEYIAKEIAPFSKELDEQHSKLVDGEVVIPPMAKKCIDGLTKLGVTGLPFSRRLGGQNLPWTTLQVFFEMISRADVALGTYIGFSLGPAWTMLILSAKEGSSHFENNKLISTRFDRQIRDFCSGKEIGAMALTEPHAGSDLSQIKTKATKKEDGSWTISGQKIWITWGSGEHHLVLARSEDAKEKPGLTGLSLFYVPAHIVKNKERIRNIEIGGLEKKVGQNAAVTATINYNESLGELIGDQGDGFNNMLLMMNVARIFVGVSSIGICEAAYRLAKDFAKERVTMGKTIDKHEMISEYLDEMQMWIKGMRAILFEAAMHEELSNKKDVLLKSFSKQTDKKEYFKLKKEIKIHAQKSRHITPIIKYLGGELSVKMTRMAMQIMGGAGYMKEYLADKLVRDSLLLPIYEGTSQIQSLMVIKDHLKEVMKNPIKFLSDFGKAKLYSIFPSRSLNSQLICLKSKYFTAIKTVIMKIIFTKFKNENSSFFNLNLLKKLDPKKDFSFALLNAERITKIASNLCVSEILIEQLEKIKDQDVKAKREDFVKKFIQKANLKSKNVLNEITESAKRFNQ